MKTQIINTSGATQFFGFIYPHGRTLASNASVTVNGDLRSVIASGLNRYSRERELAALDAACTNGDICIVEVAETCCSSSSGP